MPHIHLIVSPLRKVFRFLVYGAAVCIDRNYFLMYGAALYIELLTLPPRHTSRRLTRPRRRHRHRRRRRRA
jgi:hypothetical protein